MIANKKIKSAALWSSVEALTSSLLSVISIVFLARVLSPNDYGQIATAQVIAALVQMVLSFGLTEAVIQRKELTLEHQASVFWGSIFLAIIGIIVCAFIAYYLSLNSGNKYIPIILLFEGGGVFLNLLVILPTALLLRNLEMSAFTKRTVISRILFFAVAVPLALGGYGLWSIVWANFFQVLIATLLVFHASRKMLPKRYFFSYKYFSELVSFGIFVMIENVLWSVMSRILSLLIFTFHGTYALGLFNMATRLTDAILNILNTVIGRIALPIFSSVQDDLWQLKSAFKKATMIFNFVSMPAFFGIALTCHSWVPLVLGEKWIDAITVIQIIAVMNGVMFSRMFVGTVMKAIGESRRFLYLSASAAVVTIFAAVITRNMSLVDTLLAWSCARILITIPLGVYLMKKIFGMSAKEQLLPVWGPVFSCSIMGIAIFLFYPLLKSYDINLVIESMLLILLGVISYTLVSFLLLKFKFVKLA